MLSQTALFTGTAVRLFHDRSVSEQTWIDYSLIILEVGFGQLRKNVGSVFSNDFPAGCVHMCSRPLGDYNTALVGELLHFPEESRPRQDRGSRYLDNAFTANQLIQFDRSTASRQGILD